MPSSRGSFVIAIQFAVAMIGGGGCTDDVPYSAGRYDIQSAGRGSPATCDSNIASYARCSSDADCFMGGCENGTCYIAKKNCSRGTDCQLRVPSRYYNAACIHDPTRSKCSLACNQ
jgi:hypothetical protein